MFEGDSVEVSGFRHDDDLAGTTATVAQRIQQSPGETGSRPKAPSWSLVIGVRAAPRVLPLSQRAPGTGRNKAWLEVFRASAISRFISLYPNRQMNLCQVARAAHRLRADLIAARKEIESAIAVMDAMTRRGRRWPTPFDYNAHDREG